MKDRNKKKLVERKTLFKKEDWLLNLLKGQYEACLTWPAPGARLTVLRAPVNHEIRSNTIKYDMGGPSKGDQA